MKHRYFITVRTNSGYMANILHHSDTVLDLENIRQCKKDMIEQSKILAGITEDDLIVTHIYKFEEPEDVQTDEEIHQP